MECSLIGPNGPFVSMMLSMVVSTDLDTKFRSLLKQSDCSVEIANTFKTWLCDGGDRDLFRVNPLLWADEHDASRHRAIDLFLWATHLKIVQMSWGVMCRGCGAHVESFPSLTRVHSHFFCPD
jgi:hypothetical protein